MRLGRCLILTHPARLGDSVLSLPLHRALGSRAELHSNVGEPYRFLFTLAGVETAQAGRLYPKGAAALLREARQLRSWRFDTVFLLRPNFRSALLARLAGIPQRVGDPSEARGILINHKVKVPKGTHQLNRIAAFGEAVGVEVPTDFGLPRAPTVDPPMIGIVAAASYSDKMIPAQALRAVCELLLERGYRLTLLGGPGEEQWAEPLLSLEIENWIGRYALPELVAPLGSLSGVVAADGGLYHFSVGCGVPSVGVYGPTAHKLWWHDWGPHVPVLAPDGKMENVGPDLLWEGVVRVLNDPEPGRVLPGGLLSSR